jgi:hypothetical protein
MANVVIPYSPRPLQVIIHNELKRFNVVVCHRRFGKTVFGINELIKVALTSPREDVRVHYIAPFRSQAKRIAWDYAKKFSAGIPGHTVNESELRIDYPNGARLELLGADNPDSMRGIYSDAALMDEYAQMAPSMWTEIVRPAIADRKGMVIFIGTPKGQNSFYYLFQKALANPRRWFTKVYKASETGILDEEEIEDMCEDMSPEEVAQELECSWTAAIKGAYYSHFLTEADDHGRIIHVPWEPAHPVYTAWDLGLRDSTAIWYWQVINGETRIIEYEEFTDSSLEQTISHVINKPYTYGEHFAPHDIETRELSTGKSRKEFAANFGIYFETVPRVSVQDGIEAARVFMRKCWFDERMTAEGRNALLNYRKDWDERRQVFRDKPRHDWSSHAADAFRYMALAEELTSGQFNSQYAFKPKVKRAL